VHRNDIETPALVVDLDAMDRNIRTMADWCTEHGVNLRPHMKLHRSPAMAARQIAAGAIGMTCAKLAEAELLADRGVTDLLVANQVVGPTKVARLAALAGRIDAKAGVDSEVNLREISAAAQSAGTTVGVLVELDIGMDRCGVATAEEALALARLAVDLPGIRFAGLMGYAGHKVADPRSPEKDAAIRECVDKLVDARRLIEQAGIPVEIVSGGGTGSFHVTGTVEGVTELQCGTYVFMDDCFADAGVVEFDQSVRMIVTVVSTRGLRVVADAGRKSIHPLILPKCLSHPGLTVEGVNAEHTILAAKSEGAVPPIGTRLELSMGYADGVINLHEKIYGLRGDTVEDEILIEGRAHSH
jgi:D-serine deaminase-like pyridoxal phosphate-dependent protein